MIPHLPSCPACNNPAEDIFFNGVFIVCSKTGCNISTDKKDNIIDARVAWGLICEYYPNPVPEIEK